MSYQSKLKQIREYRIWTNMKTRCFNCRNRYYARYGGRGITVCERWRDSFRAFLEDMGPCPPGLTIERKNNDVGYEPDNCIWASPAAQSNNRTSLRWFDYKGKVLTIAGWARETGVSEGTIRSRLNRGEPIQRAIEKTLWHAKLNAEDVKQIRLRLALGESHANIAGHFGVDRSTVTAINCGKNWQ